MSRNFGLLGVAGYVAPRHLEAIRATGNALVLACDPSDSVGVLDRYSLLTHFVRSESEFRRALERFADGPEERRVHHVSVCSPNHLHVSHSALAMRAGADVICEKPLALTPAGLDELAALEHATGRRVSTILQLRVHERLVALRERLLASTATARHQVVLTYVTGRGPWYHASWKGDAAKSGGIAMNIGVHLFDLLLWLFGPVEQQRVYLSERARLSGHLELERASVSYYLSVDPADAALEPGASDHTSRSLSVDGEVHDFTHGFAALHTRAYADILGGRGLGLEAARPSVELTHRLKSWPLAALDAGTHALCRRR